MLGEFFSLKKQAYGGRRWGQVHPRKCTIALLKMAVFPQGIPFRWWCSQGCNLILQPDLFLYKHIHTFQQCNLLSAQDRSRLVICWEKRNACDIVAWVRATQWLTGLFCVQHVCLDYSRACDWRSQHHGLSWEKHSHVVNGTWSEISPSWVLTEIPATLLSMFRGRMHSPGSIRNQVSCNFYFQLYYQGIKRPCAFRLGGIDQPMVCGSKWVLLSLPLSLALFSLGRES